MSVKTVCSKHTTIKDAVADLRTQAKHFDARMVLYFASSVYAPAQLSAEMQQAFSGATVIGCSTAGELISGQMLKGSIVAMLMDAETIRDVRVEVVEQVSGEDRIADAFRRFEAYYHTPMATMDVEKYVGLILIDGVTRSEERVMEKIGDLTSVIFVGGSAGDDLRFEKTFVYANGKAYADAAVLVLLEPAKGFDIIKTQSFRSTGKILEATQVDEAARKVFTFNQKPALQAYAEALGVTTEEASHLFMRHPLGLMMGSEPYVRSPMHADQDEITFYCNIRQGMRLHILENTDIIHETHQAIEEKQAAFGPIGALINFNCILRTLEMESKGLTQQYGELFSDIPTVGFSTYGEDYIGHVNQTATILVLR